MSSLVKVLHYVAIMDRAGEETFIMNVFRTVDRASIMFDFLVTETREGDYEQEIYALGGKVRHLRQITEGGPLKRLKNCIMLKQALQSLKKEYSVFHIHTQHAMDAMLDAIAAQLAGFRMVIVHSHSSNTLYHVKAHYLCRQILNYLPIVRLACSEKAGKWLFGKNGRFEIVTNGIITNRFLFSQPARNRIREEQHWGGRTVIGHVGSFTRPKNHAFLLEVFCAFLKLDPNAILAMAGKGELMEEIKGIAEKKGITERTCFLGSRSDVNQLYSAFDVLLFPSHYEGLPVTLVEAQAADLPCLISDVITIETDINPKLKRMSLDKSADEWAQELMEMIKDKNRKNIKELMISSQYDIGIAAKRLFQIYSR